MRAVVIEKKAFTFQDMPAPSVGKGEVKVSLKTAGLNHRDLGLPNRRKEEDPAFIVGSDGAGIIEEVGEGVTGITVGDEVLINPSLRWEKNQPAPPATFDILGMPDDGTFTEQIVVSEDQVEKKPAHFTWEEAGVFALGALTGYRAMFTKGELQKGQTVFIPGAGSGVATLLIQFAKAIGARVIVSSRDEGKRKQAKELGADIVIDTNDDWKELLKEEEIDLVIDSVGAATFNRSLEVLKKGGRIVIFGATTDDSVDFNLRSFFYGQYQLIGSTMGCREELQAAIKLMTDHALHPVVDRTFSLEDYKEAFDYLAEGKQFGKVALEI